MKRIFFILSLLLSLTVSVSSQSYGFDAHLIAGLSAAQIRGDDLAGFNKVGFEGGIGASYEIRFNMDLGLELLYSQRGSRPELGFGSNRISPVFNLDYLSIPVVFSIKDWLKEFENEISYYKVKAEAGLAYSRLLEGSVEGDLGTLGTQELSDAFKQNEIMWLLGLVYQFNHRMGARLRYNRSITKLFKTTDHPDINYSDLLPFHLSIQLTYKL